jgi:hypothetical protein
VRERVVEKDQEEREVAKDVEFGMIETPGE